jgi:hypothetical protein
VKPALIGIFPNREFAVPAVRGTSIAPNAMRTHAYSALLGTISMILADAPAALPQILTASNAHPKHIAQNVSLLSMLKMDSAFLAQNWINAWSVKLLKMAQNVLSALMIDIISTSTKNVPFVMSSMMAALNAQPKIYARNANQPVFTYKTTSAVAARFSMAFVSNAQHQNIALNASLTNTISMMLHLFA